MHSKAVCQLALHISQQLHLPLEQEEIENAALLHDIGIIATDAPGIDCYGSAPYLCHGVIGADMLRTDEVPEKYAKVAERHTGAGLTTEEIEASRLPLPSDRSYLPQTLLERLICYADCFYSKGGDYRQKSIDRVRQSMDKFGGNVRTRFEKLHQEFGDGQ